MNCDRVLTESLARLSVCISHSLHPFHPLIPSIPLRFLHSTSVAASSSPSPSTTTTTVASCFSAATASTPFPPRASSAPSASGPRSRPSGPPTATATTPSRRYDPRGSPHLDAVAREAVQQLQGELHDRNALPGGEDFWREDAGRARAELPGVLRLAVGRRGAEDRRGGDGSPAGRLRGRACSGTRRARWW